MTVSAQTTVNSSTGNGATTVFPYTFKILRDADLEVKVDGVTKTLTTHYTVSGAGNNAGGNVTFVSAPANGAIVVRRRNMQFLRESDYQYQGDLPNTVLNPDLDAPVMMAQQLQEQVGRSLRGPAGETWTELAAAAARLDKFVFFNATTGAVELSGITYTQVASAVAAAYAAGSTADAITYLPAQSGAASMTVQEALRLNFNPGNQTAVAGGVMRIDALMETGSPNFPLEDEGGIWIGKVHTFAGISKEYTSSEGQVNAAQPALFVFANNNNCPGDVVAVMGDAVARTNNDTVFGANFIVRNAAGTTGTKLCGVEIDVEPSIGTTVSSQSAGLLINAFTLSAMGPAIQVGGVASGTFSNGILLDGIASTGAGLAPVGSAVMDSLFNTGSGVYTTAAGIFANTHKLIFQGVAANAAYLYNDSANSLHIVGGSAGTVLRNNADTVSTLAVSNTGILTLASTGTLNFDAAQTGTTVGAAGGASALPATPLGYFSMQRAGVTVRVPYYN